MAAAAMGCAASASAVEYWNVGTYAQGALNYSEYAADCAGPTCNPATSNGTTVSTTVKHTEFNGAATAGGTAMADLATGQLHASAYETGPVAGGSATASASFSDTVHFDVGSITGIIPLTVTATVHGTFGGDGSPATGPYGGGSFSLALYDPFTNSFQLTAGIGYMSDALGDIGDTSTSHWVTGGSSTGPWSQVGPDIFIGTYYLDTAHPDLMVNMNLDAFSANGGWDYGSFSDFGHTAGFSWVLPEGVTFTSDSGVFLTKAPLGETGGVPEPAAWALMLAGFGSIGAILRSRRGGAVVTA
jgi:hypothetical protein